MHRGMSSISFRCPVVRIDIVQLRLHIRSEARPSLATMSEPKQSSDQGDSGKDPYSYSDADLSTF